MTNPITSTAPDWERQLRTLLPLFGHRNWIVVADSAYPAQSKPGIETITTDVDQIEAVEKVRDAITASRHVRANVYVDRELSFIEENDAPGIVDYRHQLGAVFYGTSVMQLPHEEIIAKLDRSAQVFRILIIKTEMTIPYTSVFFELGCGYWNDEAEERLRQTMLVADLK
jgi:L-fucose mutarotase/ribose pyranase (RbsD/FucU family)